MFKGDLGALGQLTRNLGKLASIPSRVASEGADRIAGLIAEEFTTETDPNGAAWAALQESTIARKYGDSRILQRTEAMKDSVDVRPMAGAGISIAIEGGRLGDGTAAGMHQGGFTMGDGSSVPARPVLPGGTFPATWNDALSELAENAAKEALG